MSRTKRSKKEFNEYLKIVENQNYPIVKPIAPNAWLADYSRKRRILQKGTIPRE